VLYEWCLLGSALRVVSFGQCFMSGVVKGLLKVVKGLLIFVHKQSLGRNCLSVRLDLSSDLVIWYLLVNLE